MRNSLARASIAAAALLAAVAAPAAQGSTESTKTTSGLAYDSATYERLLAAEAEAGVGFDVRPEVTAAKEAIQARVQAFVDANGTRYTFATSSDPTIGKVVFSTDAPRDVVSDLVGEHAEHVNVVAEQVVDSNTRRYDSAPFWGGAGIKHYNNLPCTTGYAVKNAAAQRFLVTAGHCFSNGQSVWVENTAAFLQNTPEHVGTVSGKGLPSHDMSLIGGKTYAGHIYVGSANSSLGLPVAAASNPAKNVWTYCHSGRTTGEKCGHGVVDVAAQFCSSSGCKSPVAMYKGGTLHDGGDSGAPFFSKFADNSVAIRGHVIGRSGEYGYVEMWSRVSAKYGVSIVTG